MGSALFSGFQAADGSEDQLDDAVVLELAHTDQLRCCSNNDPESWMGQNFFDVHGRELPLAKS